MYGLQDGEQTLHKEAAPRRVEQDEEDVKKMKGCFSLNRLNDKSVCSQLGCAYHYLHRSSSATLNFEPYQTFFPGKICIN